MTQPVTSIRDALLEMLAAVGVLPYRCARLEMRAMVGAPPYRSARLLRAIERAQRALALKGLCENCDDTILVEFRYDLQLYLCDSCYAFRLYEMGVSGAS